MLISQRLELHWQWAVRRRCICGGVRMSRLSGDNSGEMTRELVMVVSRNRAEDKNIGCAECNNIKSIRRTGLGVLLLISSPQVFSSLYLYHLYVEVCVRCNVCVICVHPHGCVPRFMMRAWLIISPYLVRVMIWRNLLSFTAHTSSVLHNTAQEVKIFFCFFENLIFILIIFNKCKRRIIVKSSHQIPDIIEVTNPKGQKF